MYSELEFDSEKVKQKNNDSRWSKAVKSDQKLPKVAKSGQF